MLCSWVGVRAQTQEYLFSFIGEKDGLNQQNINGIQQDKKGYIWIATHNALQRYDGQRFLTFQPKRNKPGAIPESGIRNLLIDNKNRLWMLSGNTRIGYFDVDRFIFHEVPVSYSKDILSKSGAGIYQDADGNVMLILIGKTVFTYNEARHEMAEKYNKIKLPLNWKVNHMWQQASTKIYWMGCDSGLVKYNPDTQSVSYRGHNAEQDPYIKQFENARSIINTYIDKTGRFWITHWPLTGLFIESYRPGESKSANWRNIIDKALQGSYFEMHGITELKDGTVWMSGQNLLAKENDRTGNVEIIKSNVSGEHSIRYDRITQLLEDREKNVWIGTDKGLFRFNPSAQIFKTINNRVANSESLYKADVTDILQHSNGEILVSTWGAGVFSYDKYFNPVKTRLSARNKPDAEAMVWCMLQTKNGDLWKGSQDGYLFIYNAATGKTIKLQPAEFEKSTIRQIVEDTKGNIWFGTQKGDLIKRDFQTGNFSVEQKLKSIISRLYVDVKGDVWVCTSNSGVYNVSDAGNIIEHYTADNGGKKSLIANGSADIIQYDDSIYVIAGDGLNLLDIRTGNIVQFTSEEGLPSTNITNLVKDKQGHIWMTFASGIASFHPLKSKLSAYNYSDGIPGNAFSLGAGTTLTDGRIVFGTNYGMLVFDPQKITSITYANPKVIITELKIHNATANTDSVSTLDELRLNYQQNALSFQFSTLTYQNAFNVVYKMDNIDADWKLADKLNTAIYNYLPPGSYTFQVACKNPDGSLGEINTVKIRIDAPFWKTWWFYGLLSLLGLVIVYWLDKQRINRMRREEAIRTSIAGNLHEEVSTTLQNINVLSEIAGMKADEHPEQSKDYIHEIKQKSRNMVTALNDVLWSIDPANDSMEKNIDRMREMADSLINKYETIIEVQVEDNVRRLNLDMKKRHEFISIYKLSITSLVEHMKAYHTTAHLEYQKGILSLKIYARISNFHKGNNIVIKNINEMRKRASSVDAALDIQSDDKNASIILSMKV